MSAGHLIRQLINNLVLAEYSICQPPMPAFISLFMHHPTLAPPLQSNYLITRDCSQRFHLLSHGVHMPAYVPQIFIITTPSALLTYSVSKYHMLLQLCFFDIQTKQLLKLEQASTFPLERASLDVCVITMFMHTIAQHSCSNVLKCNPILYLLLAHGLRLPLSS